MGWVIHGSMVLLLGIVGTLLLLSGCNPLFPVLP